jgi:hypothetical protein
LDGDGKDAVIVSPIVLFHKKLVHQGMSCQLEPEPDQELWQVDYQSSQPDGPFVGQRVTPVFTICRAGLIENACRIPIAVVAPPTVLQRVLNGLSVMALVWDAEGWQNPSDCSTLLALNLLNSKSDSFLASWGNDGTSGTTNATEPAFPFTQGTRTVQQGLDGGFEVHFVFPQRAVFCHILAQASNHRSQFDPSLGQDDTRPQYQSQRYTTLFLRCGRSWLVRWLNHCLARGRSRTEAIGVGL